MKSYVDSYFLIQGVQHEAGPDEKIYFINLVPSNVKRFSISYQNYTGIKTLFIEDW